MLIKCPAPEGKGSVEEVQSSVCAGAVDEPDIPDTDAGVELPVAQLAVGQDDAVRTQKLEQVYDHVHHD